MASSLGTWELRCYWASAPGVTRAQRISPAEAAVREGRGGKTQSGCCGRSWPRMDTWLGRTCLLCQVVLAEDLADEAAAECDKASSSSSGGQ